MRQEASVNRAHPAGPHCQVQDKSVSCVHVIRRKMSVAHWSSRTTTVPQVPLRLPHVVHRTPKMALPPNPAAGVRLHDFNIIAALTLQACSTTSAVLLVRVVLRMHTAQCLLDCSAGFREPGQLTAPCRHPRHHPCRFHTRGQHAERRRPECGPVHPAQVVSAQRSMPLLQDPA
jgi:hypothetical protein